MFVIADGRNVVNNYLFKIVNGNALITVDISQTEIFKTKKEANEKLSQIKNSGTFEFKIYELTLKK